MAIPEFLYLDSLPIDSRFYETGGINVNEDNLEYREQFNLSILITQAEYRLSQHSNFLYQNFRSKESETLTFNDLNKVIESFLCLLNSSSTIVSIDQNQLTSHFEKRKQVTNNELLIPSSNYLRDLLYTDKKTWAFKYGSLAYALSLEENYLHYLHPSEIIDVSVKYWINSSKEINNSKKNNYIDQLISYLNDDSVVSDRDIYLGQINLLKALKDYDSVSNLLNFYSNWLPQIIRWYLDLQESNKVIPPENTNAYNAYIILKDIALACLNHLLDNNSFRDLNYKFVHQSLSPTFYSIFDELLTIRKRVNYTTSINEGYDVDELIIPFIDNVNINMELGKLKYCSLDILNNLMPPGGYNLVLVVIAAALLNRAYILTHPTRMTKSFINWQIYPLREGFPQVVELFNRVNQLIYMAGYTLRKSSLDHLTLIGSNLSSLSQVEDNLPVKIEDLRI